MHIRDSKIKFLMSAYVGWKLIYLFVSIIDPIYYHRSLAIVVGAFILLVTVKLWQDISTLSALGVKSLETVCREAIY